MLEISADFVQFRLFLGWNISFDFIQGSFWPFAAHWSGWFNCVGVINTLHNRVNMDKFYYEISVQKWLPPNRGQHWHYNVTYVVVCHVVVMINEVMLVLPPIAHVHSQSSNPNHRIVYNTQPWPCMHGLSHRRHQACRLGTIFKCLSIVFSSLDHDFVSFSFTHLTMIGKSVVIPFKGIILITYVWSGFWNIFWFS